MALKLSTPNPFDGIAVDAYWKIVEVNINFLTSSSHVTLSCFVDKQARLDGKQPIASRSFDWSGADFPFTFEALDEENANGVSIAYEKIKNLSTTDENGVVTPGEFALAVDA